MARGKSKADEEAKKAAVEKAKLEEANRIAEEEAKKAEEENAKLEEANRIIENDNTDDDTDNNVIKCLENINIADESLFFMILADHLSNNIGNKAYLLEVKDYIENNPMCLTNIDRKETREHNDKKIAVSSLFKVLKVNNTLSSYRSAIDRGLGENKANVLAETLGIA